MGRKARLEVERLPFQPEKLLTIYPLTLFYFGNNPLHNRQKVARTL